MQHFGRQRPVMGRRQRGVQRRRHAARLPVVARPGRRVHRGGVPVARAAVPSAALFYNEYKADWVGSKFLAMEDMARDFIARSVPLDGIGLQMHLFGRAPPQYRLEEAMRRVGELGLKVQVSELDDATSLFSGTTAQKLDQQAQAYQTVAAACQAQLACRRLTTWGFTDAYSLARRSGDGAPLRRGLPAQAGVGGAAAGAAHAGAAPGNHLPGPPGSVGERGGEPGPVHDHRGPRRATRTPTASRTPSSTATRTTPTGRRSGAGCAAARTRSARPGPSRRAHGPTAYRVRRRDRRPALRGLRAGVVDRAAPRAPPSPPIARPSADGAWFADSVTLGFASAGDPPLLDGSPGSGVDPASLPASADLRRRRPARPLRDGHRSCGERLAPGSGTAPSTRPCRSPPSAPSPAVSLQPGTSTDQAVTVRLSCTDEGSGMLTTDPDIVVSSRRRGPAAHPAPAATGSATRGMTFGPIAVDATPPTAPSPAVTATVDTPVALSAAVGDGPGGAGVDPASIVWSDGESPSRTGRRRPTRSARPGAGPSRSTSMTVRATTAPPSSPSPSQRARSRAAVRAPHRPRAARVVLDAPGRQADDRVVHRDPPGRGRHGPPQPPRNHHHARPSSAPHRPPHAADARALRPGVYRLTVGRTTMTIRLR